MTIPVPTPNTSCSHEKGLNSLWQKIHPIVKDNLILLEDHLSFIIKEDIPFIHEIGEHLVQAGGKRIRPILLFLTAHLCGYKGETLLPLASALELIHTATLLHDDVIDESPKRRGSPTAHILWGNKASILVGDFLFSKAFTCMIQANSMDIMHTLANASERIAAGELLELNALHSSLNFSLPTYLEIIEAKTGALFQAACKIGALLGNASTQEILSLTTYGNLFGLLFQIKDDLIDYTGDPHQIGKTTGNDFREKKITLPIMLAYQHASAKEKTFLEEIFSQKDFSQKNFIHALDLLEKYKIPSLIYTYMEPYQKKALDALDVFAPSTEKELLLDLLHLSFLNPA